ncbi:hypothetical protein DICVIV_06570 [Dictyocaulus viviparus]|uniref:UBX domain-containing protein n=1 Tax=Dictyocaulus viviparus TaxID=29172 RepID=A0A0D8XS68_DICVI|nr:hypothetical protein DICVIV_06570 [Dictyocaulus viviparus]
MNLLSILESFSHVLGEDLAVVNKCSAPSCSYMNRQYIGPVELESTTLLSIGIVSGKCLIRYQRVDLSKKQLDEITTRMSSEAAEKQILLKSYAQKKAENDSRKELEKARIARFEEELRMSKKRKQTMDSGAVENVRDQSEEASKTLIVPNSLTSLAEPDRLDYAKKHLHQVDTCSDYPDKGKLGNVVSNHIDESWNSCAVDSGENVMEDDSTTTEGIAISPATPCDRQAVIFYRQISKKSNAESEEMNDKFFEIDVEDVRAQLKQLREEVRSANHRGLISKEYVKQKNRERKLVAYRHTVVRIPLGTDRTVQAQFRSTEPISNLFEWIRSILPFDASFSLKLALNQKLEDVASLNFVDVDVAPKSTVFIKFSDPAVNFESLCQKSLRECSQNEADDLCSEWLQHNTIFEPFTAVVLDADEILSRSTGIISGKSNLESTNKPGKTSMAPKWFKK